VITPNATILVSVVAVSSAIPVSNAAHWPNETVRERAPVEFFRLKLTPRHLNMAS
jgi:hypothetical protein